jgi:hypothetical protein
VSARSIYGLGIVLALLALGVHLAIRTDEKETSFRFRQYEPFLGIGRYDEIEARTAFLKTFPPGTPIDAFEAFFRSISGRCFTLSRDAPGELTCIYGHRKYPFLPFWPVATTWMVVVSYDAAARIARTVEISVGTEGT